MRIAIVGSGIAGLSAAWLFHKEHEVKLFEKDNRFGGHAHTVDVKKGEDTEPVAVDSGFIVYNELNYPNLIGLYWDLVFAKVMLVYCIHFHWL